jgi:hypothetical protein
MAARHPEGVHPAWHIRGPGFVLATLANRAHQGYDVAARGKIESISVARHIHAIDRSHDPRQSSDFRRIAPRPGVRVERVRTNLPDAGDEHGRGQANEDRAAAKHLESV